MKPLCILHVVTTIERGGAENHLRDLVERQRRAGNRVVVAYLKGQDYWGANLGALGARVVPLHMKFYGDVAAFVRLRRLAAEVQPDIVHAHGAPTEIYALVTKSLRAGGSRLVITRHEPRIRLFRHAAYDVVDRITTRAVDAVIAVSGSVMDVDVRRRPALARKSRVAHHGIDPAFAQDTSPDRVAASRRAWKIPEAALVIGTIARHRSEKSLDTLLEAFALAIRSEDPQHPLRLVIVGKGYLTAELKALSARLGLEQRVVWEDYREDIPTVLASFDVFVLASREEGFGLVLLEAMALERPIVASRVDAIPEIILDDETGILCPPCDAPAFSRAILRLAADPALRARLGRAGRERLARHFTLDAMFERVNDAYRAALAET